MNKYLLFQSGRKGIKKSEWGRGKMHLEFLWFLQNKWIFASEHDANKENNHFIMASIISPIRRVGWPSARCRSRSTTCRRGVCG